MKLVQKLIPVVVAFGLVACSSAPRRMDSTKAPTDREDFITYADERLDAAEKYAKKSDSMRQDALIRDARIELEGLKTASSSTWRTYRDRVNSSLDRIDELQHQAE